MELSPYVPYGGRADGVEDNMSPGRELIPRTVNQ